MYYKSWDHRESFEHALAGEPWFGRVTQPGFKNNTPPRFSFRGTWV